MFEGKEAEKIWLVDISGDDRSKKDFQAEKIPPLVLRNWEIFQKRILDALKDNLFEL